MVYRHTLIWQKHHLLPYSGNRLFWFASSELVRRQGLFCVSSFIFCYRGPGGGRPWPNPTNANSV